MIELNVFVTSPDGNPVPNAIIDLRGYDPSGSGAKPMEPSIRTQPNYFISDKPYVGAPVIWYGMVTAAGFQSKSFGPLPVWDGKSSLTISVQLSFKHALLPPSREDICLGQTTQQGLTITTQQFGAMPWWGACWAWLTPADRRTASQQLQAAGDTICLIQVALDGRALYDEPNQFYSVDKFPPLTHSIAQTVDLIAEALALGFSGVWLFLDGDNGNYGYPVAVQQSQELGPALAAQPSGNLNRFVVQFPGWDGVFYGYEPPSKVTDWANTARAAGALYVGLEHNVGHIPLGEGGSDYLPGGRMEPVDVILGEFNDGQFDDTVWQILARMIGPAYIRPPEQPAGDDPPPVPFYLEPDSPRGPFYYRCFEYAIYGWVRGTSAAQVATWKAQFQAMGAAHVC